MKKAQLFGLFLFSFFLSAYHANAQQAGDLIFNANYSASFPLSKFKSEAMGKKSWKGFGGDLMYYINDKFAAGIGASYQGFEEKTPSKTYAIGNESYTGVLSSTIDITPILAKGLYSPLGGSNSPIQPYISAGVGIGVVDFDQYLGMYSTYSKTSGRFMAQGGIGFNIPFGRLTSSGLQFGANYNYINYNQSYYDDNGGTGKLKNLGNVSAYIGVHFPIR